MFGKIAEFDPEAGGSLVDYVSEAPLVFLRSALCVVAVALLTWISSQAAPAQETREQESAAVQAQPTPIPLGPDGISAKKVLLIGLDGVRVDVLAKARTPNIDALIAEGSFSDEAQTRIPTVSGPGWSSMLSGVWADKHGVRGNNFSSNNYDEYPDFLGRLERIDPAYSTAAFATWPPLVSTAAGGPMIAETVDTRILIDGDELGYDAADRTLALLVAQWLVDANPDAVFVYLGNIDVVGHESGSLAPEYLAEIEKQDVYVGALVSALRRRPSYDREDWLILMSTDHGRRDDGGHGGFSLQERRIFYLAAGDPALKGHTPAPPNIVDIAVTALTHLGVGIDPEWNLDGEPVGLQRREAVGSELDGD